MKRAAFVGNGANLVSDNGASWSALLNKLAGTPKTVHEKEVRDAKPFTLWFEEIASKTKKKNLKKSVAMALKNGLEPNSIHTEIMALGFENVLTTNYDYNLESSTKDIWKSNIAAPETYFSLFRRRSFGDKHVWHIHGELSNVGSIMLGHQQYSGYTNKIGNFLSDGVATESKARNKRPYLSKYSGKKSRTKGDVENWVDVFLESEVHMIGFGLDYTENHLWHLIMEKRRLRKKDRKAVGRAIFHRCSDRMQSTEDEARLSILKALDVKVIEHTASTYLEAYRSCIQSLSRHR